MNKLLGHTKTVLTHKWYVFNHCRKAGITWRGIKHDMSKFSPIEFFPSVKYWTGAVSPIKLEKQSTGRSKTWAHHKGRNTHHWQYWTDWSNGELYAMKMPIDDVKEMFCDILAASKVYNGKSWVPSDVIRYYSTNIKGSTMHPDSASLLQKLFEIFAQYGEEHVFIYMKNLKKTFNYERGIYGY